MGEHALGTVALYIRASVALASCGLAGRATAVSLAAGNPSEMRRALDDGLRDLSACALFACARSDVEGRDIANRAFAQLFEARYAADRECAAADAPLEGTPCPR